MQHEMCLSKGNGLKSSEKTLNESIEIFSSVFGQDVHEVWEQWSTSVLIVKGSIWEWQYNSIFLPGNTKYLCRELPAKDLVGFATEGFVCEVPISSLRIGLRQQICFMISYQASEM